MTPKKTPQKKTPAWKIPWAPADDDEFKDMRPNRAAIKAALDESDAIPEPVEERKKQ